MTSSHASVAAVEESDLTTTLLGDTVAAPNIYTAVQASSGRSFIIELLRPLQGNAMTSIALETKMEVANDTNMTKANYTVIRWKVGTGGFTVEALHAAAVTDDHNSGNYTTIRTQTVTLTQNNTIDLDEWRYGIRVEVPYGAISSDARLRVYSARSAYAAANTLRHA